MPAVGGVVRSPEREEWFALSHVVTTTGGQPFDRRSRPASVPPDREYYQGVHDEERYERDESEVVIESVGEVPDIRRTDEPSRMRTLRAAP